MKQLLTAGVLAIGFHGILLGMNFKWTRITIPDKPKTRVLNMTLTAIPINTIPKTSLQKPKYSLKKPIEVKKKKKKLKHISKTKPKKTVQIPIKSKKKEAPKASPERPVEKTESHIEYEQPESPTTSKKAKQKAGTHSSITMIHQARPIYRSNPSPEYPRIARIRGYQGNVLLDVLVNKDGKVQDLKIFRSSGYPLLDRAAISSVKHWLFEPGMIGDKRVDMWVRVPIRFELK